MTTASIRNRISSDDENDSIWLFSVMEIIGANDEYRKSSQQAAISCEILKSFGNQLNWYFVGSFFEGTITPGEPHDLDFLICHELYPVIEDTAKAEKEKFSLLMVTEAETPAGYVKLQLVLGNILCMREHLDFLSNRCFRDMDRIFSIDKHNRIVLCDLLMLKNGHQLFLRPKNKPAVKHEKYYNLNTDTVISYRCKTWPTMVVEWLSRHRCYGWPTPEMIHRLKSLGTFLVNKGHPFSSEIDLEWRISLTLQERELMFNLTKVQHKCYIILKMINRNIINFDCITTYHWKTCLFYVMEENNRNIWEKRRLFHCVQLCIKQMLKWVKCGVCPNYFIPRENLFDGRLDDSWRLVTENVLEEILNVGFDCLLYVQNNNICDYIRFKESEKLFNQLQAHSRETYYKALNTVKTLQFCVALDVFYLKILVFYHYQDKDINASFIYVLWHILQNIENTCIVTEHTAQETKSSLSLLLPHIFTCLSSNISAMAIQNPNPQIRKFLLLGSFTYFMESGLSGRLKFISVLYASKLYKDCEMYLNNLDEEDIKYNPSFCCCRHIKSDLIGLQNKKYCSFKPTTCLTFLQTEHPITPDALKYEMFKYVGISIDENERVNRTFPWHYRAVVDCNIYFFLLKYLVNRNLGLENDAAENIRYLLRNNNVRHRDVAVNVLAWMHFSEGNMPLALYCSTESWKIMKSWDLGFMIFNEKMKRKQYQFNSAKIFALVILYNTWYASKSTGI